MNLASRQQAIEEHVQHGDMLAAVPLATKFAEDFPGNAAAQYLCAETLLRAELHSAALKPAERACELDGGNFQYMYLCGLLYNHFRLYEYALPYLKKSVSIEPRASQSQFELGFCYFELKLGERALPHFRQALKLLPPEELKDEIRMHLANCLQVSNQQNEAIPILKRLITESEKNRARAFLLLAEIESPKPGNAIESKILKHLESGTFSNHDNRVLWLAIGRIKLNGGKHGDAFQAWENAAECSKRDGWQTRSYQQEFANITSFYCDNLFQQCARYGHESSAPIFIAGMPRSGTTLTEQIIAAHSQADGVGELARAKSLDDAFRNDYRMPNHVQAIFDNARNGELRVRAEDTLLVFKNILGAIKKRVVEKLPHNFIYAGYQSLLFPHSKFIHLRRHPADSFISTYQNNFSSYHTYGLDQVEYIKEYAFHENLMRHWKSIFGDRILTVQYENLAQNPETEARRIVEFVEIPWEDQCLRFHERSTTVRTFSTQQVRQPVYTSSVERWRVYEPFLGPLFKAMDEMGLKYPPEN